MNTGHPSNRRFLFSHIPKSGGTTLGRILRRNFGDAFYPYYGLFDHYMFQAMDVQRMCDLHPQYRCIASHLISLQVPFASPNWDFRVFSFVRDPVERALSLYFYTLRLAEKNPGGQHPGNLEEFFLPILSGQKRDLRFFNAQTRFLAGNRGEDLDWTALDQHRKERKILLVPLEAFDDGCLLLENWFPEDFRDTAYPGRQNLAPRTQEVPEEIRAALARHNAQDRELYEKTRDLFYEQLEAAFGTTLAAARQNFAERCRAVAPDWLAEEETAALTAEERRLFNHLKKENRELKAEVERLGRVPLTSLTPPLRMRHVAALLRRLGK